MQLNSTHQLLVYADDVNILGRRVKTIKKSTEALLVAIKVIGLKVNADKIKYIVMSQDQNAGQSHNMKIDTSSFERVEEIGGECSTYGGEERCIQYFVVEM